MLNGVRVTLNILLFFLATGFNILRDRRKVGCAPLVPFKFLHQNICLSANNLTVIYSRRTRLIPPRAKARSGGMSPIIGKLQILLNFQFPPARWPAAFAGGYPSPSQNFDFIFKPVASNGQPFIRIFPYLFQKLITLYTIFK